MSKGRVVRVFLIAEFDCICCQWNSEDSTNSLWSKYYILSWQFIKYEYTTKILKLLHHNHYIIDVINSLGLTWLRSRVSKLPS